VDKVINKCAHLWLYKPARRVNRVDALGLDGQIRDRLFDQTLCHGISIKEAWKLSDAKTADASVK
jgi:hypothetical protein